LANALETEHSTNAASVCGRGFWAGQEHTHGLTSFSNASRRIYGNCQN